MAKTVMTLIKGKQPLLSQAPQTSPKQPLAFIPLTAKVRIILG